MIRVSLKYVTIDSLLSKIGGFWTALSSITLSIMTFYLYDHFMKRQVE